MKIVAINGSPRGRASNSSVMVGAFLKGAEAAGAEVKQVFLAEKDIKYCRGCHACWTETPGRCVIQDEMSDVLSVVAGASVFVLATPVHFVNISGTLKVFMDRLTVIGSPHPRKGDAATEPNAAAPARLTPQLLMISNCGFPDQSQFQVISLWIKRVAAMMQTELVAEFYAQQGRFLATPPEELRPALADYLKLLESAGKEVSIGMKLSEETAKLLKHGPCWGRRAGSATRTG